MSNCLAELNVIADKVLAYHPLKKPKRLLTESSKYNICTVRDQFLDRLKGGEKLIYKRYLGSPLRYAGGKSLAVGFIIERLPNTIKRLISPFLGGGSVEIACGLELGIPVIAYDVFDILCNYWQVQLKHPEVLYQRLSKFQPTRKTFAEVKERLRQVLA